MYADQIEWHPVEVDLPRPELPEPDQPNDSELLSSGFPSASL